MPSTQAASHGAGQSRPVNSGKLLVACRRSMASASGPGHEVVPVRDEVAERAALLQNGMPQSMQRLAWVSSRSAGELLVDLLPVLDADRHRPAVHAHRA
jgi:hypothetical protein